MTSRPVAASDDRTWKSSVDLPMPGGPNSSVTEPATTPPPMTRSSSLTPVGSGWMPSVETSTSASAGGPSTFPAFELRARRSRGRGERVPLATGRAAPRPLQRRRVARRAQVRTAVAGTRAGRGDHGGDPTGEVSQDRGSCGPTTRGRGGRLGPWRDQHRTHGLPAMVCRTITPSRSGYDSRRHDRHDPSRTPRRRRGRPRRRGGRVLRRRTRRGRGARHRPGHLVRQKDGPLVELVADEDGTVVGHLQAAPGRLDGDAAPVAGVAPVWSARRTRDTVWAVPSWTR